MGLALVLAACTQSLATPTPTPTPTVTPIPSSTPSPTRIPTPTAHGETSRGRTTAVNRIAYIDADGALYTVSGDGSGHHRLTEGMAGETPIFYTWPTWSPDGRRLAVSRVNVQGPSSIGAEIYSITTATGAATKLYQDPPDVTPLISDAAPHYMYWSPDGKLLAFLAQTSEGLTLFVSPVDAPERLDRVISGASLYLAWAAKSRSLLMHVEQAVFLLDTADGLRELGARATVFKAPAWSPQW